MGARRTREEWAGLIAELETSGQSAERFCAKHRIRVSSLKWWRWRLRQPVAAAKSDVRLVPVDVIGVATARPASVSIAVSGVELRVEIGADVEYVGALVSVLRSRC